MSNLLILKSQQFDHLKIPDNQFVERFVRNFNCREKWFKTDEIHEQWMNCYYKEYKHFLEYIRNNFQENIDYKILETTPKNPIYEINFSCLKLIEIKKNDKAKEYYTMIEDYLIVICSQIIRNQEQQINQLNIKVESLQDQLQEEKQDYEQNEEDIMDNAKEECQKILDFQFKNVKLWFKYMIDIFVNQQYNELNLKLFFIDQGQFKYGNEFRRFLIKMIDAVPKKRQTLLHNQFDNILNFTQIQENIFDIENVQNDIKERYQEEQLDKDTSKYFKHDEVYNNMINEKQKKIKAALKDFDSYELNMMEQLTNFNNNQNQQQFQKFCQISEKQSQSNGKFDHMRKYERLYNEAVYEGANDKRIAVTASDFIFDEISNKRNDFIEHEYNDDVITDILKTLATIYYSDICNDEELFEESTQFYINFVKLNFKELWYEDYKKQAEKYFSKKLFEQFFIPEFEEFVNTARKCDQWQDLTKKEWEGNYQPYHNQSYYKCKAFLFEEFLCEAYVIFKKRRWGLKYEQLNPCMINFIPQRKVEFFNFQWVHNDNENFARKKGVDVDEIYRQEKIRYENLKRIQQIEDEEFDKQVELREQEQLKQQQKKIDAEKEFQKFLEKCSKIPDLSDEIYGRIYY